MIRWVRRIAFCIGAATFFVLFAVGAGAAGRFSWDALVPVGIRAIIGAGIIWLAGIIIADILVKGIVADMPVKPVDPAEPGIVRRVAEAAGNAGTKSGESMYLENMPGRFRPKGTETDDSRN